MIPVSEPVVLQQDIDLVVDALKRGEISGSFGAYITEFEKRFAEYCECKYGIATSNGTTALHLAVLSAGIGPGDEVIVSTFTNIATVFAIVQAGATPVAADSERDTWNMDVSLLPGLLTSRTKAILPVHIYGHPVDMEPLLNFAAQNHLLVIEDCAEAHGALFKGRKVGGLGDIGCFSFYANKVIVTGEGGMLTTNNEDFARRARLLRNLAFTQPRFRHEEIGFNYRMTNYQAAMGVGQLSRIESIISEKRRVAALYSEGLAGISGLQLPVEKNYARNVYWMYGVKLNPEFNVSRDMLMTKLNETGIETRTFFCPMNLQPCFHRLGLFQDVSCPVSENLWQNGLYLPSTYTLDKQSISFITETIGKIQRQGI